MENQMEKRFSVLIMQVGIIRILGGNRRPLRWGLLFLGGLTCFVVLYYSLFLNISQNLCLPSPCNSHNKLTTVSYQLLLFHLLCHKKLITKKLVLTGGPGTWLEVLGGNWFFRWGLTFLGGGSYTFPNYENMCSSFCENFMSRKTLVIELWIQNASCQLDG